MPGRVRLTLTSRGLAPTGSATGTDEVLAGLRALADPEVRVDIDVAARRGGRSRHLHVWQAVGTGRVATLATCDGRHYELDTLPRAAWGAELARLAELELPLDPGLVVAEGAVARTPGRVELPLELLLATATDRTRRPELLVELTRLGAGTVLVDGRPATDAGALVTALHVEARGRLEARVRGTTSAPHRPVGRAVWLHYPDGWRRLSTYQRHGVAGVRFAAVDPSDLSTEVTRLVEAVGG